MKQSLLGGLISVIAATTKGAVDNKDNIKAGLQSEAGKAYQDSLTATLSKQIKTVGSADSTVVCSAEEKENLKNVVSGLQSQISSIAAHATLAAAFVLFFHEGFTGDKIYFHSDRSGPLSVKNHDGFLSLNFPSDQIHQIEMTPEIMSGFNICPVAAYLGKTDYMLIFDNEEQISNIIPDYPVIEQWPVRGVIVTAPGVGSDFVSRFFAPQSGVNEDPVTGSAHTSLTPYWSAKLNKNELTAIQLSPRRGFLQCTNLQDRVEISGKAKLYLKGEIFIEH